MENRNCDGLLYAELALKDRKFKKLDNQTKPNIPTVGKGSVTDLDQVDYTTLEHFYDEKSNKNSSKQENTISTISYSTDSLYQQVTKGKAINAEHAKYKGKENQNKGYTDDSNAILYSNVSAKERMDTKGKNSSQNSTVQKTNNKLGKNKEIKTQRPNLDVVPPILPRRNNAKRDLPELPITSRMSYDLCFSVRRMKYASIAVVLVLTTVSIAFVGWKFSYNHFDNKQENKGLEQAGQNTPQNSNSETTNIEMRITMTTEIVQNVQYNKHRYCDFTYETHSCYKISDKPMASWDSKKWCGETHHIQYLSFDSLEEFHFVREYLNWYHAEKDFWIFDKSHTEWVASELKSGFNGCYKLGASIEHLLGFMFCGDLLQYTWLKVSMYAICKNTF